MPLTDVVVKKAKGNGKPQKLFDSKGLFLYVSPIGGKHWRLKYRFAGKEKLLSLGSYPELSLKEAREKCEQARKLLTNDVDPTENRKALKTAASNRAENSFEVVAREWFQKFEPTWVPSYSGKLIRRLARDVFPWIGSRPISEIEAPELLKVVKRIEERGLLETAHRTLVNCGQIFRYAIQTGRATRDCSKDLRGAIPPAKEKHYAAITEPPAVGGLLRAIDGYKGNIVVHSALRLAPLVFVRPGELRHAEWKDIDLEKGEWRFIVSKAKIPYIVPLSRQAVEILKEIQPFSGNGKYVFPGARTPSRPMSNNAILAALRSLGYTGEEMTGHGFRAMARTIMDEVLNIRPDIVEHQLGHAVRDPLGRAYNRTTFLEERRKMMQSWSDYLDLLRGKINNNCSEQGRK
ncbi:MAG: integrase arm-type DNA-binding domain-containing protein [Candidatus Riflebacteria bacterium]|nr:integrase arm-type DNA-binding domain-containing protein [Candidatus Riflebacteria bacterium]